ncbi:hypothetical protein TRL7639_00688 [Falsiruegeria litorea R37]|uniref:Uncharacterized protein n=1 Tax=Falsiruegeria litorea R37 TaxID=1200284 RepID=A0A1Y5RPK2_9RHOB|nr:hypothetical protein TRL7639_00688 [Falsiruegeria litorea R37]
MFHSKKTFARSANWALKDPEDPFYVVLPQLAS